VKARTSEWLSRRILQDGEGEGVTMGDSIIATVYFPLIITGLILTIMWAMGAAGPNRQEQRVKPSK
jgi:hypothetical protein